MGHQVKKTIVGTLPSLLLAAVISPRLLAQSLVSGDISGTVVDPSGAVVAGATLILKNVANAERRTTTTNDNGVYRFAFVPPGSYTVSVKAAGFMTATNVVNSNVGRTGTDDFRLSVGSSTQTVEVISAESQVENVENSSSFQNYAIQNLPDAGNDLTYIAQTAPGVNINSAGGYGNFQAYGLPAISNVFTVNGQTAMEPYQNTNISGASNLMLGRNETQEVTVTTNPYSGEFGQQAGVQVNYVTKNGTNQFHGNVVYWWTGRIMDANDWFNNNAIPRTPRPFANNNQWAGSLGGPIRRSKVFFFADNEGIAYIVPSTATVFSPSPQFASATLDNLAMLRPAEVPLYSKMFHLYQSAPNYNTNMPVEGGGCQDFHPAFGGPCFVQYQTNPAEPAMEWMLVGRMDLNLSDIDKAFFRVSLDHGTQATYADPVNSAFSAASYQPLYNGQAQWTHVFSSAATNSFIMAGSYYRFIFTQKDAVATFPVFVNMGGLGYTSMANSENIFPQGRNGTQYQFIDDYSLVKGNHGLRFGANWRRYDYSDYNVGLGASPSAYVNSVKQFYNGQALAYLQNFPSKTVEPLALWGMGLYAQDEWRVKNNLKLMLALRAERNSNPICQTNCASYFDGPFEVESRDPNSAYNSMILVNRHHVFPATDAIDWAPRLGIVWSPQASGKTIVRGGIGVFYDAVPATLGDLFMSNLPNVVGMSLCCGEYWADTTSAGAGASAAASATAIKNGFNNGASFDSLSSSVGANFSAPGFNNLSGTFHTAQYQEWSLQMEQQLDGKSSISLAYVGNHGIHIPILKYPNFFGSGLAGVPTSPYSSSFATVAEIYTGGVSNYNGMTASYTRRLIDGFQIQASYSWGHAIDDVSNGGVLDYNSISSLTFQVNPSCLACNNYGNADYDIRNSFNAAYVWALPFTFRTGITRQLLGGWAVSQNFFARSGLPFTVLDGTTFLTNFYFPPAQVIGGGAQGTCQDGNSRCLTPAAFESATAYGAFPTQTRNMWRGPGFFDSDLSVSKNIRLREQCTFQVGANLYNVFNHPNFANPHANLSDVNSTGIGEAGGNFGVITRTTSPPTTPYGSFFAGSPSGRIVQLQAKVIF